MKKLVSLLLALVMALSLCVPAYASSTAGTVALRLTGSAADQVANLKSGQRVTADSDVVVRLNVQSDPTAAEYTVALNGEAVAADHSTSQYHFYYLPAAQLSADTATLSVDNAAVTLEGEGTEESPYLIYTAAQLGAFRDKVNTASEDNVGETGAWAKLMDDIALTGDWTPIKGFTTAGYSGTIVPYTGTFDGDGHTISGLNVNVTAAGDDSAGLFGIIGANAAIKNLTISDSTVTIGKSGYVGAFVGHARGGAVTLTNCHTTDTVTVSAASFTASVGGLVGGNLGGLITMTECSNAATVTGGAASATKGTGGLLGETTKAFSIQRSFNAGKVSSDATSNVGGLVGYASGTVFSPASQLTDVYSVGDVAGTAGSNVGGFIGKKDEGFKFTAVTNAYTCAIVTAGDGLGCAIVGSAAEEIPLVNVYKMDESQEDVGGYVNDSDAAFKEPEEMMTLASTLGDNWKDDTEELNGGFPVLTWQQKDSGEKPGVLQGDGTESNPYQIPDAKALNTFRDKVNEDNGATKIYAKLTGDITLTDDAWTPIETFIGQLDGQDHTISGIKIDATGNDQGFIRFTKGDAVIKNLTIANSSIAATQTRVGAFVGRANDTSLTLINCHTAADVTVSAKNGIAGGLVGQAGGDVTITNCSNRAAVTSTGTMNGIGGLVGHAYSGSGKTLAVSQSFNTGAVTGAKFTGGLVGQVSNMACTLTMTDVYNTGTVSNSASSGAVGGLIGYVPFSSGYEAGSTTITNAYNASTNVLLGKVDAGKAMTLTNVYKLDGQETVGTLGDGAELTGDATAKTAEEMQEKAFGKTLLGGSFTRDFLNINAGYPVLKWQNGDAQEPVTLVGSGTKDDPYLITDASDMAAFRDKANSTQPSACATLMADIDLQSEVATKSWTPIGTTSKAYSGTFDGNGHTIRGIQIDTADKNVYAALFGWTTQSTTAPVIKNLTIANSTIINEAGDAAALLCFGGGVIENCHTAADVTVKAAKVAGGLVATSKAYYAAETPTMTNCSNRAAVTQMGDPDFGVPKAGGLIGYPYSVVMTGCFNAGTVSAESTKENVYIGGLIGDTDQNTSALTDVYNVGSVTAPNSDTQNIGGLVGHSTKALDIKNAYQSGTVANKSGQGGVVGYYGGGQTQALLLLNVYKTGDLPDYLAKGTSSKFTNEGIPVTVEQLKGFTDELGMNFIADLPGEKQLNSGLPILDWQDPDASASDMLYITVRDVERKARLGSNGAADPESPTLCEINIDCGLLSTNVADMIRLVADTSKNNGTVRMGTGLNKDGTLTGEMTENSDGILTADGLYFAKHPAKQTRTVYVAYTRDGETRYYQVNINRSAKSGVAYGSALSEPATSEDAPYIASAYDANTGYLTGTVNAGYQQFTDGEVSSQTTYGMSATGTMAENGFTVGTKGSSGQKVTFARPGRYWKTTASASSEYDRVPLAAWWGSEEVAQKYLDKANALKDDAIYAELSEEFKTAFEEAIAAVEASKSNIGNTLYPSSNDVGYDYTGTIPARDALGAVMTGEYLLEAAENQLLNLMDIISTWKLSASLGADKYTALTRLTDKLDVLSVLQITDDASLARYETNRGYVWTMLQATSRTAINTVLAKAGCSVIVDGTPVTPVDQVNLWVGKTGKQVYITSDNGSVDPANPTVLAYDFAVPADGRMEQIFITLPEGVQAGTSLSKTGTLSGVLELVDGKYTNTNLFFYDQPKAQSKDICLVFTDNGTNYYYKVTATRAAKTGLNIGPSNFTNETSPLGLTSGTLSSGKSFAAMVVYQGTTALSGDMWGQLGVKPQWSEDANALVYADSSNVYVKRHGWYWMPVSYTLDGETATGYLPMVARLDNSSAAKYINAAAALETSEQYASIPDEAKNMMSDAIAAVQAQIDANTLASAWNYDDTKVNRRNYYGGPLRGTDQVELEANTILDLTAIFTKWGENADLANYQWQGYQTIAQMDGGIFAAKDITSGADRDFYQKLREAKWTLLQATDLDGVNAVLLSLNLSPIGAETSLTISTADELAAFASRVNNGETNLDATLTADISLADVTWTPITGYTGTFDGDGHTISGLNTFDASATTYIGLFGTTGTGAVIQNLIIDNSTITGAAAYMGAIVAYGEDSLTLENCQTTKDVTVTNTSGGVGIGGLVGAMKMASASDTVQPVITMTQCSNAATVSGKFNTQYAGVGGLIGAAPNGGTITNSCNNGAVTNNQASGAYVAAGGLVGAANRENQPATALTLTNVYNTGTVWAKSGNGKLAGGLVGDATWGGVFTNAYSTMSVKTKSNGSGYGGVIVGTVSNPITVTNVYAELIRGQNTNCNLALTGADRLSAVEKMFNDTEMPVKEKVCDKLGEAFKQDTTGTISGCLNYPVLAWQSASAVEPEPEPESAKVTVTIGGKAQELTLSTEDESTESKPAELTVTAAAGSGSLDRIYFSADENVVLGTKLTGGAVADADKLIAIAGKGSTAEGMYFYRTPAKQDAVVYAVFTDSTARAHYYKLTVTRPATEGYALGEGGFNNGGAIYSEVTPGGTATTNSFSYSSGKYTVTASWKMEAMLSMSQVYDAMCVYNNGAKVNVDQNTLTPLAEVDWDTLTAASNGLYTTEPSGFMTMLSVARPGSYWFPVSLTYEGQELTGMLPMEARTSKTAVNAYISAANTLLNGGKLNDEAKAMLNAALANVNADSANVESAVYLAADGTNTYTDTKIAARNYYGAPLTGAALLEKDINTVADMTAIFSNTDETQAGYQWQAYQQIMNKTGAIHAAIDIQSDADRDSYQELRQAKWDLLQTTDLDGVNAILTKLGLEIITAPEPAYTLGDINENGTVADINDVTLSIWFYNGVQTPTDAQLKAADINGNGVIDINDVTQMIWYYNGVITEFNGSNS